MELKQEYEKLREKYNLPNYKELNNEFELMYIPPIIEISYPLRFIRRRMMDKVGYYCNLLQGILIPNSSSFINMQESKFFENHKNNIVEILKRLMYIERESILLDTKQDEKQDVEFIKKTFNSWLKIKEDILPLLKLLRDGWKEEVKKLGHIEYFG